MRRFRMIRDKNTGGKIYKKYILLLLKKLKNGCNMYINKIHVYFTRGLTRVLLIPNF